MLVGTAADHVILKPGQRIELAFQTDPVPDSMTRVLLLKATGRYETLGFHVNEGTDAKPGGFEFNQNYPNPFNPNTTFSFALPLTSSVKLDIYNVLGQKVVTLIDQEYQAGRHIYEWDGKDNRGKGLSSGVYFARLTAGEFTSTRKMVVVK